MTHKSSRNMPGCVVFAFSSQRAAFFTYFHQAFQEVPAPEHVSGLADL
jgi:hypothetical protein